MSKVYFKPVSSYSNTEEINKVSVEILNKLIESENIPLENVIPLKITVGEKGNTTYINPVNFNGIIDYLEAKKIKCTFMETNVLYKGQRTTRDNHLKLAKEHGFTRLPLIIADGDHGENYELVEINKKHFEKCKVGKEFADSKQLLVISHFKGHMLAGFGGAVKQLGMGCAARGGKLDQHANSIPKISSLKCKACKACAVKCPEAAIIMGKKAKIDKDKCVGCASCMTVCPHGAITNSWFASISKSFNERLAEYAYAAAKDKNNIYVNFVFNITKGCDCEGHPMKLIAKDVGLLASTDPIALDQACLDMLAKVNGKKLFRRGRYTLFYGEKIGLGTRAYELINL
jgi:uncharacterized Fe-S center protein